MLLDQVKQFVNESFQGKNIQHFERTAYWVKHFKPDADEALLIAAYGHDIERAFRSDAEFKKVHVSDEGFLDKYFLTHHQKKGAEIIADFLKKNGADEVLIRRVSSLIQKHEVGGSGDHDLLMDCDSISFFETNAQGFRERHSKLGLEKIEAKLDWMYERISSVERKKIAKPLYEKVTK